MFPTNNLKGSQVVEEGKKKTWPGSGNLFYCFVSWAPVAARCPRQLARSLSVPGCPAQVQTSVGRSTRCPSRSALPSNTVKLGIAKGSPKGGHRNGSSGDDRLQTVRAGRWRLSAGPDHAQLELKLGVCELTGWISSPSWPPGAQ